jgi:hypothetical protein
MGVAEDSLSGLFGDLASQALSSLALRSFAVVRRKTSWTEGQLDAELKVAISDYLKSTMGKRVIRILVVLSARNSDATRPLEEQANSTDVLFEEYATNVISRLGPVGDRAPTRAIIDQLTAAWDALCMDVQLQIVELKRRGELQIADTESITAAITGSTAHAEIPAFLYDRSRVLADQSRLTALQSTARLLRRETRLATTTMQMPHVREHARATFEQLYVERTPVMEQPSRPRSLKNPFDKEWYATGPIRTVLIGSPGAGKSTFVRHLVYEAAKSSNNSTVEAVPLIFNLVQMQERAYESGLLDFMVQKIRTDYHQQINLDLLEDLLTTGMSMIVFDGLDEIASLQRRRSMVASIESFSRRYPFCGVLVTSRRTGYDESPLDPVLFPVFSLPEFTELQVIEYVNKWFKLEDADGDFDPESSAQAFLTSSQQDAGELRRNPLMLSLLCTIYKNEHYIPENRPAVYEQCAELLLHRWDRVREIPRALEVDAGARQLIYATAMHYYRSESSNTGIIESDLKRLLVAHILEFRSPDEDVARTEAQEFIDFCAGRAWLLTHIGNSPTGERLFGFTHRTFAEYFSARYLAREAASAKDLANMIEPLIRVGVSEVVPQMAIQWRGESEVKGADKCLMALLDLPGSPSELARRALFAVGCLPHMVVTPDSAFRILALAFSLDFGADGEQCLSHAARANLHAVRSFKHYLTALRITDRADLQTYDLLIVRRVSEFRWLIPTLLKDYPVKQKGWREVFDVVDELIIGVDLDWAIRNATTQYATFLRGQCTAATLADNIGASGLLAFDTEYGPQPGPALLGALQRMHGGQPTEGQVDAIAVFNSRVHELDRGFSANAAHLVLQRVDPFTLAMGVEPRFTPDLVPLVLVHAMLTNEAELVTSEQTRLAAQSLFHFDIYREVEKSRGLPVMPAVLQAVPHMGFDSKSSVVQLLHQWCTGVLTLIR